MHRNTAEDAWKYVLGGPVNREKYAELAPFLDDHDSLDLLGFNPLHKIITGLSNQDLEHYLELHPELVNAPDSSGDTPLIWAVRRQDLHVASLLLEYGADVNIKDTRGATALHLAVSHLPCLEALINAGADVNVVCDYPYSSSALDSAVAKGNLEATRLLLDHGADPNTPGYPAIMVAAEDGRQDLVEVLVNAGADVDHSTSKGEKRTAVHSAVQYNRLEILRYLLHRGARLDIFSGQQRSIMRNVALYADIQVMGYLAERRIRGLPMEPRDVSEYWDAFNKERDLVCLGEREPLKERAAFEALLNSQHSWAMGEVKADQDADVDSSQSTDVGWSSDDDEEDFVDAVEA